MVAPARCFIIRAIRIPSHPYSIGLLNAVARLDTKGEALMTIPGNPPNLLRLTQGYPFQPRYPHAMAQSESAPPLEPFLHKDACAPVLNPWRR